MLKKYVLKIIDEYKNQFKIDDLIFNEISFKENIIINETFQS